MTITFDIPAERLVGDVPVLDAETGQDERSYWHLRWTIDISQYPEETE